MHAIRVHRVGEPEVMRYEDLALPTPGAEDALIQVKAAGVNFIDTYIRSGSYSRPLPLTLGFEGAGIVTAVGAKVTHTKPGDRVAWTDVLGSYASHVLAPANRLVPLPESLSFEQGAAAMLQGITAQYLTHGAYWLKTGDTCLVHAAAGGVGLLLCQIGKIKGARVIGTVSSAEKARIAQAAGADETIIYTEQDFSKEISKLTQGAGVNVVYDSVGKDTFEKSLASLGVRGFLVSFGQSSGPVPLFDLQKLAANALFLTRPSIFKYTVTHEELLSRAHQVFEWISAGKLNLRIDHIYPLRQAAEAHRALEGRKTTGKILLIPE